MARAAPEATPLTESGRMLKLMEGQQAMLKRLEGDVAGLRESSDQPVLTGAPAQKQQKRQMRPLAAAKRVRSLLADYGVEGDDVDSAKHDLDQGTCAWSQCVFVSSPSFVVPYYYYCFSFL